MLESELALELTNKNILITGGTGFFGKNLTEHLVYLNEQYSLKLTIYVMARKQVIQNGAIFIEQDVSKKIIFDRPIDFIIHAATPVVYDSSTPEELLDIIVNGTQNVANLALKLGCKKFIHISSGAVYGLQPEEIDRVEENSLFNIKFYDPQNAYATGKRIAEILLDSFLKESNIHYTIVRGFAFSGKYLALDQQLAIGNFVRDVVDNKIINIKGDGTAIRSYMDSEDLNTWLITILLKGRNREVYNLGSDEAISIKELAYKVASQVEGATVNIENNTNVNVRKNRYVPSIEKAKSELGLKLRITLDQSIHKMINIYRKSR